MICFETDEYEQVAYREAIYNRTLTKQLKESISTCISLDRLMIKDSSPVMGIGVPRETVYVVTLATRRLSGEMLREIIGVAV